MGSRAPSICCSFSRKRVACSLVESSLYVYFLTLLSLPILASVAVRDWADLKVFLFLFHSHDASQNWPDGRSSLWSMWKKTTNLLLSFKIFASITVFWVYQIPQIPLWQILDRFHEPLNRVFGTIYVCKSPQCSQLQKQPLSDLLKLICISCWQ